MTGYKKKETGLRHTNRCMLYIQDMTVWSSEKYDFQVRAVFYFCPKPQASTDTGQTMSY